MNNLTNKEKNLNKLVEKLSNLSKSYSHDSITSDKLKIDRDYFLDEKNELQEKFSKEIDELNQETEELVEEIDKWQM